MVNAPLLENQILVCATSNRQHGNTSLFYQNIEHSLDNRKGFLETLGIDYRDLVCAKQIHSNKVVYVTEEDRGKGALTYDSSIPDTDAFITDIKKLPLAIFTADCLCVSLFDSSRPSVGIVHAGWKSTKENIVLETIRLMQEKFDAQPKNLSASFSPAIRNCCYEVGKDFGGALIERDGRFYFDLIKANKEQLLAAGLSSGNIFDSGICTSCRNNEYFSYRKERDKSARMLSVIMLK
ncbi:MAG: peptidoglycan editing factor PgeF [Candidatus Omnitrophica bacterium]|nr:peptidoglycan editing factor PgeF [Candidatus Omnitrophota bacterium]